MSRRSRHTSTSSGHDDEDAVLGQSLADRIEQRAQRLQTALAAEPSLRRPRIKITQAPEPKRFVMPADIDLDADPATLCSPKYDANGNYCTDTNDCTQLHCSTLRPYRSPYHGASRKSHLSLPPSSSSSSASSSSASSLYGRRDSLEMPRKTAYLSPGYKPKTRPPAGDPFVFYEKTFDLANRKSKTANGEDAEDDETVPDRLDIIRRRTAPEIQQSLQRCRPVEENFDEDGEWIGPRRRSALYRNADIVFTPGRKDLRQKPVDPKAGEYEKKRAKDAYRKQVELFKIRFEADLKRFPKLDFDAKQEIRIRAKGQREKCLANYRESLQGLATTQHRRSYRDTFLGSCESAIMMHDPNVLEYELRLASEMDTIINNLKLLNEDQSNRATLDWMASLAKQKFSYEYELDDQQPDLVAEIPEPEEPALEVELDLETGSQYSEAPYSVPYSDAYDPSEAGSLMDGYPPVMIRARYSETPEVDSLRSYPTSRPRLRYLDEEDTGSLMDYHPRLQRRSMCYEDEDDTDSLASCYTTRRKPPLPAPRSSTAAYFDDTDSLSSYPRTVHRASGRGGGPRRFEDFDNDDDSLLNYRVTGRPTRAHSPVERLEDIRFQSTTKPNGQHNGVNGHHDHHHDNDDDHHHPQQHHHHHTKPEVDKETEPLYGSKSVHFKRDTSLVQQFDTDQEDPL